MSAPNPPYGRRPVEGGPGSPYPTPPGGMPGPPHDHRRGPVGAPPPGSAPYRPGPDGPPSYPPPAYGTPPHGTPPRGAAPIPGPRQGQAPDPWRSAAPTDRHHHGPPTPPPGGPGLSPPPAGPLPGPAGGANPLIPPGVNGVPLPGPVPAVVQRAFLVWLAPIPLNVVAVLLTGLGFDGYGFGVPIIGLVGALVGGAVGVYLALHFRGGRDWARIVLTVISGLILLVELFSIPASLFLIALAPALGVISLAISALIAACEVLFLVQAWKAEASAYLG